MLSIEPSKNTDAAVTYFRKNLSQNDYYSEKEQIIAQWHGKAAQHLNLQGDVNAKDFEDLLYNKAPITGNKLTPRNSANRRPMYDFTFSPVKSVSVLQAITGDQDIIDAHHKAVQKTMLEVEANIQTQIGTQGKGRGKEYVKTGNLIYAEFLHDTTRPTLHQLKSGENYVPDPQLHSHCAVINATFFNKQNKWRAIEIYGVKKQAPYYEALYHSYMAENLKAKGYEIYKTDERWEIKGVSRQVIEKYSTRTEEINSLAQKEGISDPKHKAKLGRITRHDKNKSVADNQLKSIWKDRLTLSEYHSIMNAKKDSSEGKNEEDKLEKFPSFEAKKAIDKSLQHYMERNSGIEKNRVLAYAIKLANNKATPEEIKDNLESRPDILSATNKKGIEFITTHYMNEQEGYLIERAAQGRATRAALNPKYTPQTEYFTKAQKMAVKHVLNSGDEIILVSGDAGTGKTTLLREIQEGLKYANTKLHMFAPSSDAAKKVLRSNGFKDADTIARLLIDKNMQERTRNGVICIDEAGLVGVPTMNRILTLAQKQNVRLILSGDWKQHSSVEAGCAMKLIETKSGIKTVRVNEIVRQRHVEAYKKVVEKMAYAISRKSETARKEHMQNAYESLNKNGDIIEIKGTKVRHDRIADDYLKYSKKKGDDALVVSPTIREGKVISQNIREKLRDAGRIGKKDKEFQMLRSKQFTVQEKQNPNNYERNDVIEFHQNVSGFKAGLQYFVMGKKDKDIQVKAEHEDFEKALPTRYHNKYEVYQKEDIQFARRDSLRITKNTKSIEGQSLHNGQTYDVKGFDWRGDIILSNGATLPKEHMHMAHGYVTTSPASQGKTAKTVLIAQHSNSGKAAYDSQFYVSVSRGVENCKVYTDNKYDLKQAISKSNEGMSATEISELNDIPQKKEFTLEEKAQYMDQVRSFYDTQIAPRFEAIKNNDYGHEKTGGDIAEPEAG